MTLGSSQRKYSWHDAMTFISLVLNNFMKNLFIAKSNCYHQNQDSDRQFPVKTVKALKTVKAATHQGKMYLSLTFVGERCSRSAAVTYLQTSALCQTAL